MKKNIKFGKRELIYSGGLVFTVLIFLMIISFNIIGFSAKQKCLVAQDRYHGDCIEAMMAYLADEDNSFRGRNSVIWALGQYGDVRAVSVLENLYTGYDKTARYRLDEGISQYELYKALKLTKGGFNITAVFWR